MDHKIKYDPTLGKGQSERSKKKYKDTKLYRVVPFVPVNDVISIVAGIQNNCDAKRILVWIHVPAYFRSPSPSLGLKTFLP